jgi:hypothetical protein
MSDVSCADGEWLSAEQLSPDGAEHSIEVVNEVPVAWKHQVDGHGQGDVGSLAIHGIVDAHLHGLLPEVFVLTIVLGAFSIAYTESSWCIERGQPMNSRMRSITR